MHAKKRRTLTVQELATPAPVEFGCGRLPAVAFPRLEYLSGEQLCHRGI